MSYATEVELVSLFVTARKCVEILQSLTEMGWPQKPTIIQVDNATTASAVIHNIVQK